MLSCCIHTPISPKGCKSSSFSAFDESFVIALICLFDFRFMDLEQVPPSFLLSLQSGFPHCLKGIQKFVVLSVLCDNVFSFEFWTCSNWVQDLPCFLVSSSSPTVCSKRYMLNSSVEQWLVLWVLGREDRNQL